jgi:hypothetical protein
MKIKFLTQGAFMHKKHLVFRPIFPLWIAISYPCCISHYTLTVFPSSLTSSIPHKVWGFMSEDGEAVAKQASDLYGDGTFELSKQTLFPQVRT